MWLSHAKYIHGVSGVIRDGNGRILLLRHRFWKGQAWGLPGGLAARRETPGATLRRELREETGMDVRPLRLLRVSTRRGLLTQFIILAEGSGEPRVASFEILEARYFTPEELPEEMLESHRELLEELLGKPDAPGLPLEE